MIVLSTPKTRFLLTDTLLVPVTVKNFTESSTIEVTMKLPNGEQTKFSWICPVQSEITKTLTLDAGLGAYSLITNYSLLELEVITENSLPTLSSSVTNDVATLSSSGVYNQSQWMLYVIPAKGTPVVKSWVSPTTLDLTDLGEVTVSLFNPLEKSSTNVIKLAPTKKPAAPKVTSVLVELLFPSNVVEHDGIYWVTLKVTNPVDTNANIWFTPKLPNWIKPLFSVALADEPIKAKGSREFKLGVRIETSAYKLVEETVQLSPLDGYAVSEGTIIPLQCLESKVKVQPKLRDAELSVEKLWFSSSAVRIGDTVTFGLKIVNTGDIPIEDVTLQYETLPSQLGNYALGFSGIPLAPGESYTYKVELLAISEGNLVYTIQPNTLQFESNGNMLSYQGEHSTSLTIG